MWNEGFIMRKNILFSFIIIQICIFLCGCDVYFGRRHVSDTSKYRKVDSYIDFPSYFPESIEEYDVNDYSYRLVSYFDTCHEIFLDVNLTEEQFDEVMNFVKEHNEIKYEQEAYYADGYYEIVITDYYEINKSKLEDVDWATVEKVIYNPETFHVVFECLHAHDTGIYDVDEVEYFNLFSINQSEYYEHAKASEEAYEKQNEDISEE